MVIINIVILLQGNYKIWTGPSCVGQCACDLVAGLMAL